MKKLDILSKVKIRQALKEIKEHSKKDFFPLFHSMPELLFLDILQSNEHENINSDAIKQIVSQLCNHLGLNNVIHNVDIDYIESEYPEKAFIDKAPCMLSNGVLFVRVGRWNCSNEILYSCDEANIYAAIIVEVTKQYLSEINIIANTYSIAAAISFLGLGSQTPGCSYTFSVYANNKVEQKNFSNILYEYITYSNHVIN